MTGILYRGIVIPEGIANTSMYANKGGSKVGWRLKILK